MTAQRVGIFLPSFLDVHIDVIGDAMHERMRQPLFNRAAPPFILLYLGAVAFLDCLRERQQALGGVGPPIQQHVFDELEQVLGNLLVNRQLAGVDDAHVHAGANGMVEKRRVHRLAHRVIAAEGKRNIADAAADLDAGKFRLDLAGRFEECDGVVVVLLDAGRDGQDVRDRR